MVSSSNPVNFPVSCPSSPALSPLRISFPVHAPKAGSSASFTDAVPPLPGVSAPYSLFLNCLPSRTFLRMASSTRAMDSPISGTGFADSLAASL